MPCGHRETFPLCILRGLFPVITIVFVGSFVCLDTGELLVDQFVASVEQILRYALVRAICHLKKGTTGSEYPIDPVVFQIKDPRVPYIDDDSETPIPVVRQTETFRIAGRNLAIVTEIFLPFLHRLHVKLFLDLDYVFPEYNIRAIGFHVTAHAIKRFSALIPRNGFALKYSRRGLISIGLALLRSTHEVLQTKTSQRRT